jgi:hypothetical protein
VRGPAAKSGLLLLLLSIARPAAAQRIDFEALPKGELLPVPATAPSGVSGANAEGLWLSAAPWRSEADQFGNMALWDDPRAAEQFTRGDYSYLSRRTATNCFLTQQAHVESHGRWPLTGTPYAQFTVHHARGGSAIDSMYPTLHAVRVERLNQTGAGATLDVTDLWLDTRAKGMRVIDRRQVALERVASVDPGATVFAARGADSVHFVIVPSDKRWATLLGGSRMTLERGVDQGASDCGHATLTLQAPAGGGETATARVKVVTQWETGPRRSDGSIAAVVRVLGPKPNPATLENFSGEVTVRTLAVHVSAARQRADRPLAASVAFQWTKELEKRQL